VVAGVEVSTDGGTTWHPATGTNNWSYQWIAHGSPSTVIRTRASDDSANVESPRAGTTANVSCPCSIWAPTTVPTNADSNDARAIEVGMRFTSDTAGFIRSVRFYKAVTNTGTHTADLWNSAGQLLGTATFTGESASGWQQANFASPVAIAANTTYVASYFAPSGHYSEAGGYFYGPPAQPDFLAPVDSRPLHALHSTPGAPNGLYKYSGSPTFPTNTFNAENYWVDVVYSPSGGPIPVPGAPSNVVATAGPASADVSWSAPTTGGAPTSYIVTPFAGGVAQATTTVSGSPPATSVTVGNLTNGTSYTFTVTAANATGSSSPSAPSNTVVPTPPPAPGAPTNVTATAGSGLAAVSWSAPTAGGAPTSYTVTPFIGATAQTPTTVTGTPPSTSTVVNGLTNGTTYTFTVVASNSIGSSASSAPSNAVTPSPTPPIAVERTVAADGVGTVSTPAFNTSLAGDLIVAFVSADGPASSTTTTSVTGSGLTWTLDQRGNSQAGTTEVWHANASTALTNAVVTATSSSGLDISITVVAFNGASGIGAHVSAGARTGAPSATLTTAGSGSLVYAVGNDYDRATARTTGSGESIVHQWVDTVSGDTFWVQSANAPTGAPGSSVTMDDTAPTTDRWNLTAVEIRRPAGATPSPQSITFGALANATLAQSPVSVSATASSGLPVSFSSLTGSVCSVAGSSVSLLATGTCTIQADQAGNASYDAAPSLARSFTVTKNPQTISFAPLPDVTLAQSPRTVAATASSGLPVSFSSSTTSVCTVSGTTVTLLSSGICTIQADQAGNGSFNPANPVQQSFSVVSGQGAQTITFSPIADATLAQSPLVASATASSGLPVSFSSLTTAVCTVSGASVTLLTPGTCTIQADQAGNGSFNPAPSVQRSFTVSKSNQTIVFPPLSDVSLSQSPVTVNATASSGLAVSFSSLTTAVCSVSGASVTLITTGTCTIQADQAGNGSFNPAPPIQQSFAITATAGGIVIDQTVFKDAKGVATTPTFSTAAAGALLVAFVGSDGPTAGGQTMTVTGAGLTWTLVKRTNARPGDAEIWWARAPGTLTNVSVTSTPGVTGFDQSLTVVAFRGASGVGATGTANAATGAPTVGLTTTRASSWVFGVGNDWDRATARTVGAGQTMVHQWVDSTTGDTYWTQSTSAPTPASGTAVAISDSAPTADRWNLTSVEVLAN
ncbi:MAG: large repetitive protein, partial [Actinomycetota bacterium]|nr:large repetitive protein [Actinomycetota bacterium]